MSFGLTSTFVVNEGQPAAWVSLLADFPPNKINGRILYATDTLEIYIDLVPNVGAPTRRQLTSKATLFENGLSIIDQGPIPNIAVLGGSLIQETNIDTAGQSFTFDNIGIAKIQHTTGNVNPNGTIILIDSKTGLAYKVRVEEI